MKTFKSKEEKFFKRLYKLQAELNLEELNVKIYRIPELGLLLPDDIDAEIARKVVKIFNEVFK